MDLQAITFIQDLAIIMIFAGAITVLCRIWKQPVVLGYILTGIIIGPNTPPFSYLYNLTTINTLAELGVIFLMFTLGLEFDFHKLKKVGFVSALTALAEITLMIWIGYNLGLFFGWSKMDAIFLGAILSISSTTIIVKALEELGMKRERFASLIFGILIVEDIFAIAILTILSGIAITGSFHIADLFVTSVKLLSFLVFSLVLGILIVPKFIAYICRFKSKEMLLITVLGLCFGFCLLVVHLDYSVALGAFTIGAIIAESKQNPLISELMIPLRDMFSAIFFVSVGLLLDPRVLIIYAWPILLITLVVVIGKVITCSFGVFLTGESPKVSMRVGMGLAQIGEFSFIIAQLGIMLKVSSSFLFPIAVAVSALTTFLTPYLIKYSDRITLSVSRTVPRPINNLLKKYTSAVRKLKHSGHKTDIAKYVYRSFLYLFINLFLILGIFLISTYLASGQWGLLLLRITNLETQQTIVWSTALLISMPFLVAIYNRVKALSMLLTEPGLQTSLRHGISTRKRFFICKGIPLLSLALVVLIICILTQEVMPPIEWLIPIAIGIIFLGVFLSSWIAKLHRKYRLKLANAIQDKDENNK